MLLLVVDVKQRTCAIGSPYQGSCWSSIDRSESGRRLLPYQTVLGQLRSTASLLMRKNRRYCRIATIFDRRSTRTTSPIQAIRKGLIIHELSSMGELRAVGHEFPSRECLFPVAFRRWRCTDFKFIAMTGKATFLD
jgi:hypothetical protein